MLCYVKYLYRSIEQVLTNVIFSVVKHLYVWHDIIHTETFTLKTDTVCHTVARVPHFTPFFAY